MGQDFLQEIPDEHLPKLRDLYKEYLPYAMHAYYWVDNYIDWKKRQITNIKFYCPEGLWNNGTFIAIEEITGVITLFVFTLEKTCNSLRKSLEQTNRIKWNTETTIMFLAVHESHRPTIENEINRRGVEVTHSDVSNMWLIPKEEASKYEYDIPSEVYLAPLRVQDAEIMNEVWPHRGSMSLMYIETLITANGGFGLYLKQNDSLCSWVLKNNYGGIALLQTTAAHMRKGYGTLLAKYFSKYWAEKGIDIFGFIMVHNLPSLKLFQRLGYNKEHGITWIHCNEKL